MRPRHALKWLALTGFLVLGATSLVGQTATEEVTADEPVLSEAEQALLGGWQLVSVTGLDAAYSLEEWVEYRSDGTVRSITGHAGLFRVEREGTWSLHDGVLTESIPAGAAPAIFAMTVEGDAFTRHLDPAASLAHELERSPEPALSLLSIPPEPETLDEAVGLLRAILPPEDLSVVGSFPRDQLGPLHDDLGMWLRQMFRLWDPAAPLRLEAGDEATPEAISMALVEALWESLQD